MNAKKLLTAALLTLGFAAVPTIASAHERYVREERVVVYERDRDVDNFRYASLPGRIQDAVDYARRGFPVDHIQRVRDNGREFYQMVIYGPRCDTFVRINCDGRTLSREEVACERSDVRDYHRYDSNPYGRFHSRW